MTFQHNKNISTEGKKYRKFFSLWLLCVTSYMLLLDAFIVNTMALFEVSVARKLRENSLFLHLPSTYNLYKENYYHYCMSDYRNSKENFTSSKTHLKYKCRRDRELWTKCKNINYKITVIKLWNKFPFILFFVSNSKI